MASGRHLFAAAQAELAAREYAFAQCNAAGGFFDIAAKKDEMLFLKVLEDINALGKGQACGMQNAAAMLDGWCFVLGQWAGWQKLREGVLYQRHGVDAGSIGTLRDMLEKKGAKMRKNKREYVKLDGRKLEIEREKAGLARKQLARHCGVCEDTIYRYEKNATMALEEHARALEEIVGRGIRSGILPAKGQAEKFMFHGMVAARLAKPFELAAKESKAGGQKIVVGEEGDLRTMQRRALVCAQFSKVSGADCFFVVQKPQAKSLHGIAIIGRAEICEIEDARELIKLVREKKEGSR